MKVAVLGATGPSGLQLVAQSLERGHSVTAIVRNPEKLEHMEHDRLQVIKADLTSEDDLTKAFTGQEAILIALGAKPALPIFGKITLHTDTIKPIVAAMRTNAIKRVIVISSWATVYTPNTPWFIEYFFKPVVIGRNLANMAEMEAFLEKECQDLDYTVVRPPGLSNGPVTEKDFATYESYYVPDARGPVSRADVTRFMLDSLDKSEWVKKMVAIAFPVETK